MRRNLCPIPSGLGRGGVDCFSGSHGDLVRSRTSGDGQPARHERHNRNRWSRRQSAYRRRHRQSRGIDSCKRNRHGSFEQRHGNWRSPVEQEASAGVPRRRSATAQTAATVALAPLRRRQLMVPRRLPALRLTRPRQLAAPVGLAEPVETERVAASTALEGTALTARRPPPRPVDRIRPPRRSTLRRLPPGGNGGAGGTGSTRGGGWQWRSRVAGHGHRVFNRRGRGFGNRPGYRRQRRLGTIRRWRRQRSH